MSRCPGERRTLADGMVSHARRCVFCTQGSVWVCVCLSSSIGHADTLSCSLRTCSHLNRRHRTVWLCARVCVRVHSLCRYLLCCTNKARSHSRWRDLTISALTCKQVIFPSVSLCLSLSVRQRLSAGCPHQSQLLQPWGCRLKQCS